MMKKRILAGVLSAALMLSLAACGAPAGQEPDGSENGGQPGKVEVTSPLTETTYAEMEQATGISLKAPGDASDAAYFIFSPEDSGKSAQVNFTRNGKDFTCRAEAASEQEAYDTTGLYYTWSEEKDVQVAGCPAKLMLCDKAAGLYWLANGVNCSLGCDGAASEEEMLETAGLILQSLRDGDGQTPEESAIRAGTWLSGGGEGQRYFFFDADGASGRALSVENGMGLAFAYEQKDGKYVFHWGGVDDSAPCTVSATDETHITLEWEDQAREDLTYVSPLGSEEFHFYTNEELGQMALAEYEDKTSQPDSGLSVGMENNEDGTVTIQLYQNLGDHNSTAAWYQIDRTTGRGNDVNDPGAQIDLSNYA